MSKLTEEEKSKKYYCDGKCYWNKGMCPRVDYCEETRRGEGCATALAVFVIVGLPILFLLLFVLFLISLVLGGIS